MKKIIVLIELLICLSAAIIVMTVKDEKQDNYQNITEIPETTEEKQDITPSPTPSYEPIEESEENPTEEITKDDNEEKLVLSDDWHLLLVNKQHSIPDDYEVNLVNLSNGKQVDERIAEDTEAMFKKAREDGIYLSVISAYRSNERQTSLFNNKVRRNMRQGMSYMEAYKEASGSVTPPGTSEHQLGLALDILGSGQSSLTENFSETEAGIWLKDNCADFGFILRYPEGKEYITGIIYEPWHFRYVGKKYAKEIMSRGITLEEYLTGE